MDRIGVGIDTARYGHRVSFMRPDRKPAAKPMNVTEGRAGYESLEQRLTQLHQQYPDIKFYVRIDAAGQYAADLEAFLRGLALPLVISVGEPKRNKDYHKAHFPKRTTDDTESQAMARFAVVEQPEATPAAAERHGHAPRGRRAAPVQGQADHPGDQPAAQPHAARTFPELATLAEDLAAGWVLKLLARYPTAERVASAHPASLEKIPHLCGEKARAVHEAAKRSVASFRGEAAEALVREHVAQVRRCRRPSCTSATCWSPPSPISPPRPTPGSSPFPASATPPPPPWSPRSSTSIASRRPPTWSDISASSPRRAVRGSTSGAGHCPSGR